MLALHYGRALFPAAGSSHRAAFDDAGRDAWIESGRGPQFHHRQQAAFRTRCVANVWEVSFGGARARPVPVSYVER